MSPPGRPTVYDPDLAERLLARIAAGETVTAACRAEGGVPRTTLHDWVRDDRDGFADRFRAAREAGCETLLDEILVVSRREAQRDEPPTLVARDKLRVSSLQWVLSRTMPAIYGLKTATEVSGPGGAAIVLQVTPEDEML